MAPSILDQKAYTSYGDWRDEFYRNGYVVLKNVISREKALNYREKALDWLQSFNTGFDINDQSTWTAKNLPQSFKAGMYLNYCAAHEKYVWDARMYVSTHHLKGIVDKLTSTTGSQRSSTPSPRFGAPTSCWYHSTPSTSPFPGAPTSSGRLGPMLTKHPSERVCPACRVSSTLARPDPRMAG